MHNILIIAKREYLERVRQRSFLIMTILIPALMFAVTVIPSLIANTGASSKHVVVVAADKQTAELIRAQIQNSGDSRPDNGLAKKNAQAPSRYQVDLDTDTSEQKRAALTEEVKQKKLDGVIWATDDAIAANKVPYITRDTSSLNEVFGIQDKVSRAMHRRALKQKGLSDGEVEGALKPVELDPQNPTGGGKNPLVTFFTVFSMVMVLYITVLLYGINVMRAVLEEKTSRIMEVMLATCSAKEMMAGKILGVGAVGLTQIAIWVTTSAILGGSGALAISGGFKGLITGSMLVGFAVFFLLGYTLYATLCAAVGAMVNSEQEAQQMQFFVMMPMILSVIILVNILQYPGTPLAFWASIFPFTAPLIMFARIALETPKWWEIALSIGLLVGTIYGLLVLCGRIYRVGILMYGKKPTLPEIIKWVKYS